MPIWAAATYGQWRDRAVEVPINHYPDRDAFAAARAGFGSMVTRVDRLSAMSAGDEAILLYDLDADGLGTLRVAEQFTVRYGGIVLLRQIHDTEPVRSASLAAAGSGQARP